MRSVLAIAALTASALLGTSVGPASGRAAVAAPAADLTIEQRIDRLIARMTLQEKASLLYGIAPPTGYSAVGYVPGVPRLGIPELVLSDGPVGLRDSVRATNRRPATAMPATVSLAASFDRDLARQVGSTLGLEARAREVDVLYAPGVNIARVPIGGRNFEYLSEDPFLTGQLAVPYIKGVQSRKVAAQVKHFALNNQETDRHTASSNADERTMREIYLPAFEAAVRGGALSVMCANNPVNGIYSCESTQLLHDILQGEWGFDGVVGSDYAATHSAVASVNAGLDQSFTLKDWGAYYRDLPGLVQNGEVSMATLDARVRRVLRLELRIGLFDPDRTTPTVNVTANGAVARTAAVEGTVLLRNSAGLLPLRTGSLRSIAVVGPYAATAHPGGGGSSAVVPYYTVPAVKGIRARVGQGVKVTTNDGSDTAAAASVAAAADVAVVVVGDTTRENADRSSMDLPGNQNSLVSAVLAANPRTVVVLNTGGPVTMPWLAQTTTLLQAWYPGQEGGNALAAVLFGDADPSGRLPVTFPVTAGQSPSMGAPRYPAGPDGYEYTERLEVGYRGFDARGLTPLFPFGFGLSYTSFAYSALSVAPAAGTGPRGVNVSFTVTNTGARAGVAVPQVYLGFPAAAGEPPRQLKGFDRLRLSPGASQRVTVALPKEAFTYWGGSGWTTPSGVFTVSAGSSSRDLPLAGTVTLPLSAGRTTR